MSNITHYPSGVSYCEDCHLKLILMDDDTHDCTSFPTLEELRDDYRNLRFDSAEWWVLGAVSATFFDAEERLHDGRWTPDQFEAYALVWSQNKIGSEADTYRMAGAGSPEVQYLADFLASVMDITIT